MIIGLDYDNTLVNNTAIETAAKNLGITIPQEYTYYLDGLKEDHKKETVRLFNDQNYMSNLLPIEGALTQLERWKRCGHKVIIITSRHTSLRESTENAISINFPNVIDKVCFASEYYINKFLLIQQEKIEVWIDDNPYDTVNTVKAGINTYLISNKNTPYNYSIKHIFEDNHVVENITHIYFEKVTIKCTLCCTKNKFTIYDIKDKGNRTFIVCKYCGKYINIASSIIPNYWKYFIYK